ncbi:helix-turn-helix domain-containing protein [Dactylosporangium sp. NPDC000521]|uniref:helix-turn-helix domain-containing protein n=1 Tax=Dactylosporangium sp. NPDC000521 TaxID=3363975 RepID=UPI0036C749CA
MTADRRPVTDEDRERVVELHAQGLSRNEIARQIGRSGKTVSNIAQKAGLTFERGPEVAAATEARKVDAKARRAALALALLDDVDRFRAQLFAPVIAFNFGGKDNTYEEREIPEPTPRDKRDLMNAIGIAIDRSVKLDEYDSGASLGQVVSLLETLGRGLTAKYGTGDDEHPVEDDEPGDLDD